MESARISELLKPFLADTLDETNLYDRESAVLSSAQLNNISIYIDLLLRWNARINLTAIRQPEEIVQRHFGESLFAARHLFPPSPSGPGSALSVIDVGSGAGFPGLPIKIWAPEIHLTLIESNQKKSTFLREVARSLTLTNINVFHGRAEAHPANQADVVTIRAVENFAAVFPSALRLLKPQGRLVLLIGESQQAQAKTLAPLLAWDPAIKVPLSTKRILLIGLQNHVPYASPK